jgi:hypothetical protein
LRGHIYEATGNRAKAIEWLTEALRLDVKCIEARIPASMRSTLADVCIRRPSTD